MRDPVIVLDGATRSFGGVLAMSDVTFGVEPGTVTALLGPNGAGKTTTVRVIAGMLRLDAGRVRVFGADPVVHGESVRSRLGIVAANPALYDRLSGRDNLLYAARLFGVQTAARVDQAAERFGIHHALGQRVGTYSTGMKARLALARAVLHDPEVLLLDEPTAGLDPESARAVLSLIRTMAAAGKTILLCTHLLVEAERVADDIVIMDHGRSVISGPTHELATRWYPHPVVVLDAENRAALAAAREFAGVVAFEDNGQVMVQLDDLAKVPDLIAFLTSRGVRLTRVEPRAPTLEELYFRARRGDL